MTEPRQPILYLDGVNVSFDGFKALNDLSLVVEPGELRTIIGPNGAGKTTMMDVITGKTRPDSGTIMFKGAHDLTRLDEARIANLGIGRKFQKPTVFDAHRVFDNLELSLKCDRGLVPSLLFNLTTQQRLRIDEVLEHTNHTSSAHQSAGALSHGQRQRLEIGMLLIKDPELLLVDEPVAGMTDQETEATAELLRRIAGDRSVVVVEHDMEFVRSLATKVTVLHEGAVLAEGSLDHVQNDARVIEVYLGR